MKLIRSAEVKGIIGLALVIIVVGFALAAATGKLEQWFGIDWFSGPKALDRIIYVSARSGSPQIYSMKTDGTDRKQLTTDAKLLSDPAISPRGNRIAFMGLAEGAAQLMTVGAEGGRVDQLTSSATPKKQPCYSPDGAKLAFIASGRVYVADSKGENPRVVLPTEEERRAALIDPLRREAPAYRAFAWGPDSRTMSAVTTEPDVGDLLVYLPSPEQRAQRIPGPQGTRISVGGIGWAARAQTMAATMNGGGQAWFLVIETDSGELSVFPLKGYKLGEVAVSPDGSEIVIAARRAKPSRAEMTRLDRDTGQLSILALGEFKRPSFSANGKWVLATRVEGADGRRNVVMIESASGKVKPLTRDGVSYGAVWSPVSAK